MQLPNGYTKAHEVKTKRTLNGKTYTQDGINHTGNFSTGHIHYINKLGVGDGVKDYPREIDYTLIDKGTYWAFEYGSFHPKIPKYADEFVEFRDIFQDKDQIVKYKPICSHIEGVKGTNKFGECITYSNAFGEGIDYQLYCIRSGLVKAVKINEAYKGTTEKRFRFEVDFGGKKIFRGNSEIDISYEVRLDESKTFDSSKRTFIQDNSGNYTQLRTFIAWDDSKLNQIVINVDLIIENGKVYLEKIIPGTYLENSEGDVYTDTTTSYYAGSGDSYITSRYESAGWTQAQWDTVHDATSSTQNPPYTSTEGCWHGVIQTNAGAQIVRAFLPIDTSGIASGSTISAATLSIYNPGGAGWWLDSSVFRSTYNYSTVVQTFQASRTVPVAGDYDNFGSVAGASTASTEGIDSGARISFTTNGGAAGRYTMALNATGRGWINVSGSTSGGGGDGTAGWTFLGLRSGHDNQDIYVAGVANAEGSYLDGYSSERTGTTEDPYLEVTYTAAATATGNMLLMF